MRKLFLVLLCMLSITFCVSCSNLIKRNMDSGINPVSSLYCDGFMIYTMCAEDVTGDGVVDLFFFEDDDQIFFYREDSLMKIVDKHLFHPCMEKMNSDLLKVGSQLFFIQNSDDLVQRMSLKTRLMAIYISYLPAIHSCQSVGSTADFSEEEEYF